MTDTSEKIKQIFYEHASVEPQDITNETTNEEMGLDSLDVIELVMMIEKEFYIIIPDERAENLTCFLDYVNIVEELK